MRFVLAHCALSGGDGRDFVRWAPLVEQLAACDNLVGVKIGALEEWAVADPRPYLDWALRVFGFGRCMAEGNWPISAALGARYGAGFEALHDACRRLDASDAEIAAVFEDNARFVYGLSAPE